MVGQPLLKRPQPALSFSLRPVVELLLFNSLEFSMKLLLRPGWISQSLSLSDKKFVLRRVNVTRRVMAAPCCHDVSQGLSY